MLQIWDANVFSREAMSTWTVHQDDDKTYDSAVVYFNGEMEKLNAYEAASENKRS